MKLAAWLPTRSWTTVGQSIFVVLAWMCVAALHWDNDGLWFQGDSPRHAANGFFWRDFLQRPTADVRDYALSYYARYPVVNLLGHPPAFHLLEAMLYGLFGASPYVAKGLVLAFALMAGWYTAAWLRRFVAVEAGWAAPLLLLSPGLVRWSNVIMLNVPALALSVAALYHARCWLEAPESSRRRHFAGLAIWAFLAAATYFTAGIVVLIVLAWLLVERRWDLLLTRGPLIVLGSAVGILIVLGVVLLPQTPIHVSWIVPAGWQLERLDNWTFYGDEIIRLVDVHLLALAALGAGAGILRVRWRREVRLLGTWLLAMYLFFSLLPAKEGRYILLACVAFLLLAVIGLLSAVDAVVGLLRLGQGWRGAVVGVALAGLIMVQAGSARQVGLPSVVQMREVVRFLESEAPDGVFFYDGYFNGVFTYHVQAGDPDYRRRVVLGNKLLYVSALVPGWRQREFVSSPEQVVELLHKRGGCRWLAIEVGSLAATTPAARLLRETVQRPEFQWVRSFPIDDHWLINRIDVYRLTGDVQPVDEVELEFPILGDSAIFRVRPISR